MSNWDMDDETVIIDGLNFDSYQKVQAGNPDPFKIKWSSLRKYDDLEKNLRRRTDRQFEKTQQVEQTKGSGDAKTKQLNPSSQIYNGYSVFDVVQPHFDVERLAHYYSTHPYNHAAVDTKVANMVSLGYKWELTQNAKLRLQSKKTDEQVKSAHRKVDRTRIVMGKWLDNLNKDYTFSTIMENVVTDLEAVGNGYLEIGRKSNGQIGYIGHIPATTVRVRRQKDGFVQIIGSKAVFFGNYGVENIGYNPVTSDANPNQIIHFKEYSPTNTFYGVPDIVAAGQAAVGDQLAQQYNIDYFQNSAVPRYVVYVKGAKLSSDSERRLFEFMQNNLKGNSHRTLLIPLPPDNEQSKVEFNMEPIEAGVQEGSFTKYHSDNSHDILAAHQVPMSKIGQGDGSLAGTIAADRTFKEQVARPGQRLIEKQVNKLVAEVTDIVELRFKELTLTDEQAAAQIAEKYLRSQVLTPNEVREQLGYPSIDGGDEVIELNARQAADANNEAQGSDERATDRENNQADSPITVQGRKPKGEGSSIKGYLP